MVYVFDENYLAPFKLLLISYNDVYTYEMCHNCWFYDQPLAEKH